MTTTNLDSPTHEINWAARRRLAHHLNTQWPLHQEIAQRLMSHLEGVVLHPQVILNIGAGASCLGTLLATAFPKAICIALDAFDKRPSKKWYDFKKQSELLVASESLLLPFESNSVDFIISNLAIYWYEPRKALLAEIHRVLKPGGAFFFSTLGPDSLLGARAALFPEITRQFSDLHDIGDDLVHTSFLHPVMEMERLTLKYSNPSLILEDLKRWELASWLVGCDAAITASSLNLPNTLDFEIIYGHAFKPAAAPQRPDLKPIKIPISKINYKK